MAELERLYPECGIALQFDTPFQLAVATILSAQCTDKRVNIVTPALFARYPDAPTTAVADVNDIMELVKTTGFYRNKAKFIVAFARAIVDDYGGVVPADLDLLVRLPGIGRKTANVVLGDAFGIPGITVDTHVGRLARRLGLSQHLDPVKVEFDLMKLVPRPDWTTFSHRVISARPRGLRRAQARLPPLHPRPALPLRDRHLTTHPNPDAKPPARPLPPLRPKIDTQADESSGDLPEFARPVGLGEPAARRAVLSPRLQSDARVTEYCVVHATIPATVAGASPSWR